jgi:hypothetical protein
MELQTISSSDRAALKALIASDGWNVIEKIYDNYRLSLLADLVDGPDLLPEGMATVGYSAKYRAHGATVMLKLINDFAEGKDLEKKNPPKEKVLTKGK